ncbi:MAG TPA: polyprenyl synthetase family protein [Dermatophilaceae bacterium]|nr:polyprenyl synthetase family protein [Dermatophilaceae bacterium]
MTTPTTPLDREDVRARVQAEVVAELARQRQVLAEVGPDLDPLVDSVRQLLTGGKRLRAAFAYWGYRAAGHPGSDALIRLATAMEFFQAAALLHDDVMDGSDTRRGMPSAHRAVAAIHTESGWSGDSGRFGEATAILAGDLCLQWTDELFSTSGLPAGHLMRARGMFDRMRTQLMGGQFLDVLESARGWDGLTTDERLACARRVIRYKSAKYTIEHPLLIGAMAGGATASALDGLSRYGLALGEAFQLRDDLLGVFGDPSATGKPAGDDLREGKRTALVAYTLDRLTQPEIERFGALFGHADLDESGVAELRRVITSAGGDAAVEADIARLCREASDALTGAAAHLDAHAVAVLDELIAASTARTT